MSDLQYIRVGWDHELAIVVIDRTDKLNALNAEVLREIGDVFRDLREDDDVQGVILIGAGEKAFVAGADIGEIAQLTPSTAVKFSREGQRICAEIERFPKPVLAAVGGYALGGGCELASCVPPPSRQRKRPFLGFPRWGSVSCQVMAER